jgi:hypothetical protein
MIEKKLQRILLGSFFVLMLSLPLVISPSALAITSGTVEWDLPTLGTVFNGPDSFTAPATVVTLPEISNVITSNSIDLNYVSGSGSWSSLSFNGEVFKLPSDTITGISVNTNETGALVTFDAHDIYVNLAGTTYTQDVTFLDISVNPASSVPEPSTILLVGAALTGLAAYRRLKYA